MAENDTISSDLLKKLLDPNSFSGEAIEKMKTLIGEAGDKLIKFAEIHNIVGEATTDKIHKLAEEYSKLSLIYGSFGQDVEKIGSSIKNMFNEAIGKVSEFAKQNDIGWREAVLIAEPFFKIIPDGITGMGKLGDAGYEAGSKITTAFSGVKPILEHLASVDPTGLSKHLLMWGNQAVEGGSKAIGLEREIISLAAAQGRLSDVMRDGGGKFKDMSQSYLDMTNLAFETARATGQTVGSVMDLAKALGPVPGSLDQVIIAGGKMSELAAVSKLATGFMREQSDVAKDLGNMYTYLGTRGQDALESLANLYDKAGDSKLRFETFASTVMNIAGSYKMLGDNTVATTNFVKAFDEAFKGSSISPEAMKEVITGIGTGIERMDRGKQAFVSGATGGPGGLAGSYQMEYAMQTGHMDEVLKKTMTAMQGQFGGQVLTLKDAAENPAVAGEFYKQVQYLTQVAGVAKDDRDAYRILEAMKSGVMDMLKPGGGADDKNKVLETNIKRGADEQEQTKNEFMKMYQSFELSRTTQDAYYKEILQSKLFKGERIGDASGRTGVHVLSRGGESRGPGGEEMYVKDNINETAKKALEPIEGFVKPLADKITKLFDKTDKTDQRSASEKLMGIMGGVTAVKHDDLTSVGKNYVPTPGIGAGISDLHRPMLPPPAHTDFTLPGQGRDIRGTTHGNEPLKFAPFEFMPITLTIPELDKKIDLIVKKNIQENQAGTLGQSLMGR